MGSFQRLIAELQRAKTLANQLYAAGDLGAAVEIYSHALSGVGTGKSEGNVLLFDGLWNMSDKEDMPDLLDLIATLHNNRAAANLKLGNNQQVIEDTAAVIHNCTIVELLPRIKLKAWNSVYRASPNVTDIYLKARLRRSAAFEHMANTAKASEEMAILLARPGDKTLPADFHSEFLRLQKLRHPDEGHVRGKKVDWSNVVAGTWRRISAKGRCPPARLDAAVVYHNDKLWVYGGQSTFFDFWSDFWTFDLTTSKWTKSEIRLPAPEKPPAGKQPPAVMYKGCMYLYHGGNKIWKCELQTGTWSIITTSWPAECLDRSSPKFVLYADRIGFHDYGAGVHGDKMYVFSGSVCGGERDELSLLTAYDFTTKRWEHVFSSREPETDFPPSPEGRTDHQAWVHGNKLYSFGGSRYRTEDPAMDYMMPERTLMWSFDLDSREWRSELMFKNDGHHAINIPASRREFAVAKVDSKVVVYGGYTTAVWQYGGDDHPVLNQFAYLSDTLMYDHDSGQWKYVYCDSWPPYRAACTMVYVPDPVPDAAGAVKAGSPTGSEHSAELDSGAKTGAKRGSKAAAGGKQPPDTTNVGNGSSTAAGSRLPTEASTAGESSGVTSGGAGSNSPTPSTPTSSRGSARSSRSIVPGRFLMYGGYRGIEEGYSDVWELRLEHAPKHIRTVCHGCGKWDYGMLQCGGSCGGAVVFCGKQCQRSVWAEHKQWCRKV